MSNSAQPPQDTLFSTPREHIVDFAFDQSVTTVFPDMIRRSVPGYETVISLLAVIAERYYQSGSAIYDLGCSLGAATLAVHSRVGSDCEKYCAVDSSASMQTQCADNLQLQIKPQYFQCWQADIRDMEINDASVVILNFTLQFLPAVDRDQVLAKIYEGLRPGGVLILSEKLQSDDAELDKELTALYHQFKAANGYSDLEISQKRSALEKVMQLDTPEIQANCLQQTGFKHVQPWFQCFNFQSTLARK